MKVLRKWGKNHIRRVILSSAFDKCELHKNLVIDIFYIVSYTKGIQRLRERIRTLIT